MSSENLSPNRDNSFIQLVASYSNSTISDVEFTELEQRLRHDPEARAFYRRYMNLESALQDYGDSSAHAWKADIVRQIDPNQHTRFFKKPVILICVPIGMVAAILLVLLFSNIPQPETHSPVIARLKQISGDVGVISADAESQSVQSGFEIHSGDTVRTKGTLSSAVLFYPDGTQLRLIGDTTVTGTENGGRNIIVHEGTLFAIVSRQKTSQPMIVTTPKAKIHVLGTQFQLAASSEKTDLRVTEGKVKFTRLADGQSVEVSQGKQILADEQQDLLVSDIEVASDTWSEDFEEGIPENWEVGKFAGNDLPAGSKGAAKTELNVSQFGEFYSIVSKPKWFHGTVTVHEDSHLHMTFKMQNPNWLNIFLITRTTDPGDPRFANNFQFNEIPFVRIRPNEWYTISIPLSKFVRLPGYSKETLLNLIPFQVVVNSPEPDRGLVIDQISITRKGPGVVEIKTVN